MKKLNLKPGGIGEMLTREQMKKVVGGDYGGGVNGYACCWTGTSNCSYCDSTATSSSTCVSGATLTAC